MVGVDEVGDGRRGVDGVDHGHRHVAKPDIFARRHARGGRLGDDVAIGIVEVMRDHRRGDVRGRAFGELRLGVVGVCPDREGPRLCLNDAALGA